MNIAYYSNGHESTITTYRILTNMYGNRIYVSSIDASAIDMFSSYVQRNTVKIFEYIWSVISACEYLVFPLSCHMYDTTKTADMIAIISTSICLHMKHSGNTLSNDYDPQREHFKTYKLFFVFIGLSYAAYYLHMASLAVQWHTKTESYEHRLHAANKTNKSQSQEGQTKQ